MYDVLWLPSWYPSIESSQNGDFIYRHALAVSQFVKLNLLFVQSSEKVGNYTTSNRYVNHSFYENVVLFSKLNSNRYFNLFKYFYFSFKEFRKIYKNGELPDIIHVHVSYKAGLLALWLKWRYKVPFIITEHWTFFTKEKELNYSKSNIFLKFLLRLIFKEATCTLPVSQNLSNQLLIYFPFIKTVVVPNVVNPLMFYLSESNLRPEQNFKFIHVSSLNELKNPLKIIRVFKRIMALHSNIVLEVVGDYNFELMESIKTCGYLDDSIIFYGLKEHHEVAELVREAHAFILFSTSENLPCVIAESLCCGTPVISSSVGGIPEMVNDLNGILVPAGDESALYQAMDSMVLNYDKYDRKQISLDAQAKYNPETVGKQIVEIYEKVLAKK